MTKPPDRQFDAAIIGGGFAGVYRARELLARKVEQVFNLFIPAQRQPRQVTNLSHFLSEPLAKPKARTVQIRTH